MLSNLGEVVSISIHAPREGGDALLSNLGEVVSISIHAPREGGDKKRQRQEHLQQIISIHAPREGGDLLYGRIRHLNQDFNPRPPRGGRLIIAIGVPKLFYISIHAPREGGDLENHSGLTIIIRFQSTPPARGATPTHTPIR